MKWDSCLLRQPILSLTSPAKKVSSFIELRYLYLFYPLILTLPPLFEADVLLTSLLVIVHPYVNLFLIIAVIPLRWGHHPIPLEVLFGVL